MLLSQRQDFLNNHLAEVRIAPNQEGTIELRDEVLLCVAAQDMGTSGYQMSDVDDVEFHWENDQLVINSVFRSGIGIIIFSSFLKTIEKGSLAENPIPGDVEQARRTLLLRLIQQLQSPRDQPNTLC